MVESPVHARPDGKAGQGSSGVDCSGGTYLKLSSSSEKRAAMGTTSHLIMDIAIVIPISE
jgi:hypothetical protein